MSDSKGGTQDATSLQQGYEDILKVLSPISNYFSSTQQKELNS